MSATTGGLSRTSLATLASGPAIATQSFTFTAPSKGKGTATITASDGGTHTQATASVAF